MHDHHPHKKKFLNLPHYPGGNAAYREFITSNLRYPQEALEAGVEGPVVVGYDILDTGVVQSPHILKGIGYGCDEEALRLVGMLRYEKVKNRGVRVKSTTKTTIRFKLPPGIRISYTSAEKSPPPPPEKPEPKSPGETYEYTINF
ncbi:MAG TPA: energy transducer TonB [Bacteroidales bacterium]|nr:energy transducer TonB [Bacteroidales bacterium]HPS62210.1 energy transducer TonB [Bacteroidales bacterium]